MHSPYIRRFKNVAMNCCETSGSIRHRLCGQPCPSGKQFVQVNLKRIKGEGIIDKCGVIILYHLIPPAHQSSLFVNNLNFALNLIHFFLYNRQAKIRGFVLVPSAVTATSECNNCLSLKKSETEIERDWLSLHLNGCWFEVTMSVYNNLETQFLR